MKKRVKNVNLSTSTIKRGEQLAKHLKRPFCGAVEVAIDEMWDKVKGNTKDRELAVAHAPELSTK